MSHVPHSASFLLFVAAVRIDDHITRFEAEHDDYSSILLKALADRLAEVEAIRHLSR